MRVWWTALILSCAPAPDVTNPTHDAGSVDATALLNVNISVTAPGPFYVVRGESAQIPYRLTGPDASRVTSVGIVGLPPGVFGTASTPNGAIGAVTIHASVDAILGDASGILITPEGGAGAFKLAVVDVDGSLDPSFGTNGILELANASYPMIGLAASAGKIWVVGNRYSSQLSHVYIARFLETGALDTTFGSGGEVEKTITSQSLGTSPTAFAVCADGSIVVTAEIAVLAGDGGLNTFEYHALYFDASGVFGSDVVVPSAPYAGGAACIDGALVLSDYKELIVVDTSHAVHTMALPAMLSAMKLVASPPDVYVASSEVAALAPTGPSTYALDTSFGDAGIALPPSMVDTLSIDTLGNVVLGLDDKPAAVARMSPSGVLDVAFGTGGVASLDFGALITPILAATAIGPTSNDVFVVGTSTSIGFAIVRLDSTGHIVKTFGDFGVSLKPSFEEDVPLGAVFDSAGRLWVLVERFNSGGTSFLARYRVVAP